MTKALISDETGLADTGELIAEEGDFLPAVREVSLSVTPQVKAAELVARLDVVRDAMQTAMVKDVDYGVIPGTGSKPALLKPGAEKLGALFQLDVQLENEKIWHDDGHLTVISKAVVFHQPTGARLGSGEGVCSTRESKYAYRTTSRLCPACGKPAIIKGKAEYGGGWVCFKKKDGCGAKYADNDPAIVSQEAGKIPNPDIADSYNTVDKMASKRARVDAVLAVTGASAIFTQDVEAAEEMPHDTPQASQSDSPAPKAPKAPAIPRGAKMRLKIEEMAQKGDKTREASPGTTWAEVCDVIAWRHKPENHPPEAPVDFGASWDELSDDGCEWLGVELSHWLAAGSGMTFFEHVTLPF